MTTVKTLCDVHHLEGSLKSGEGSHFDRLRTFYSVSGFGMNTCLGKYRYEIFCLKNFTE